MRWVNPVSSHSSSTCTRSQKLSPVHWVPLRPECYIANALLKENCNLPKRTKLLDTKYGLTIHLVSQIDTQVHLPKITFEFEDRNVLHLI